MSGSSFGTIFHITTFGESHGPAVGVVIQGCPPGLPLDEAMVQFYLNKRKPGQGISATRRKEPDIPRILSGTFQGKTTGTPITILIKNKDAKSGAYANIAGLYRPGHGDFTYQKKYGIRDFRGGGRASARETAARVAAGAVARVVLDRYGVKINSFTMAIGGIAVQQFDADAADKNELRCPDPAAAQAMAERIKAVKNQGDSLGGIVEIQACHVPAGIGDPVFDKLDADIAKAMMGIGAVKAVEIGAGIRAPAMTGFENNDQMDDTGFLSNHSGGILAGISTGQPIIARVHVKPIPSISLDQKTVDTTGQPAVISIRGRHDICAIPRINMVCESMLALVLTDHVLRQKTLI
ncbi:MAG: chorismate synthase [Desulfotignum sp.]|nr:chorismate synthase [Desulfotignum sp.]MCF8124913.1 chorismate synthase [Desulfotignum sp.]